MEAASSVEALVTGEPGSWSNGAAVTRMVIQTRPEEDDEGTQVVVAPGVDGGPGEEMTARPWKNPNSDGYLGGKRFQIISAGPDLTFNTDDDLTWPERP